MLNLIFDFDGVIGDTYEVVVSAHVKYGSQPNREKAIEQMFKYFSTKPHHARDHSLTDEQLTAEYKWTSEFGQIMFDIGIPMFDDFVSEIESIETHNMAVVSSGSQKYVLPTLSKTDINFSHILAFEDHHSKEEKIEAICKDWGVSVKEVYYFTDTLADVYELKEFISKDKLIGVAWGFCTKEQLLTELPANQILDVPSDLVKMLKS